MKDLSVYTHLFNSDAGALVLEDLQEVWFEKPLGLDHSSLAYYEGRRSIIREIEKKIAQGAKEKA